MQYLLFPLLVFVFRGISHIGIIKRLIEAGIILNSFHEFLTQSAKYQSDGKPLIKKTAYIRVIFQIKAGIRITIEFSILNRK